jgi:predicted ArsR family transcriptional regulator
MTPAAEPEVDPRLLYALADPVRHEVLTEIAVAPASAGAVAGNLGLPLTDVRDHLRALIRNDALEPIDGSDVDADERRYRATIRPFLDDAHWEQLAPERRRELFALTLRVLTRRFGDALDAGMLDHVQTHVSVTRLQLDEQGWQELTDLLAGVLEEAMQIEAESLSRLAEGGPTFSTNLAMLYFGRPDDGSARNTHKEEQ